MNSALKRLRSSESKEAVVPCITRVLGGQKRVFSSHFFSRPRARAARARQKRIPPRFKLSSGDPKSWPRSGFLCGRRVFRRDGSKRPPFQILRAQHRYVFFFRAQHLTRGPMIPQKVAENSLAPSQRMLRPKKKHAPGVQRDVAP